MDNQDQLRILKNKIIGNPDAKDELAADASLDRVLQCLGSEYTTPTQIEAANVLYSLGSGPSKLPISHHICNLIHSSGSQTAISQLLKHGTSALLLAAVGQINSGSESRLKVALGRALRTFICSLADCCGPPRWGILPTVAPHLRRDAQSAMDVFLQQASLDVWVPLLQDASLYPLLCTMIANGIRTTAHRNALCDWLPPAERAKANKGKRGWEKRAPSITSPTVTSPTPFSPAVTPAQSWVLRQLLRGITAQGSTSPKIAVSLDALAALCKDNPSACAFLRADGGITSPFPVANSGADANSAGPGQSLLLLQRSTSSEVRIAINELLANVAKTTLGSSLQLAAPHQYHRSSIITTHPAFSMCLTILHNLIAEIGSPVESEAMRARACFIVSNLVADDRDVAEAAVDCGVIPASLKALEWTSKSPTPRDPVSLSAGRDNAMDVDPDPEEEESQAELELREGVFTLLATIGLTNTEFSQRMMRRDSPPEKPSTSSLISPPTPAANGDNPRPLLFPLLSQSILHPHLGVRYSALQLVRAFSRALATLRTSLVDSDIPAGIIEILTRDYLASISKQGPESVGTDRAEHPPQAEHRAVIITALMVLCNLLNDYAPFRESILKGDIVRHLVRKTHSSDDEVRLNATWALRNATFNAKGAEITSIIEALTWEHFVSLINDSDRGVREQAIILLQNITTGAQEIAFTVDGLGPGRLVNLLQAAMSRNDAEAVEHAIRAMNNIVTESPRELLASSKPILTLLKTNLSHSSVSVRHASASCICELLARYPFRHRELREIGVEQALRAVIGGRDRVGHAHTPTMTTGSGFGAALGSVGPFGAAASQPVGSATGAGGPHTRFGGPVLGDAPGLMGRESDREVLDAVKLALALLEKGKE